MTFDLIVVGAGAGGGMIAREAARAGLRVALVEQGQKLGPRDFTQREDEMIPLLYESAGARTSSDGSVTVLSGRGVGGSTLHNCNLCKRAPAEILDTWGVDTFRATSLGPHYDVVERDLSVSEIVPAQVNRNNALLARALKTSGMRGGILKHNRVGCTQSGFCELGCSFDAKQNSAKVLIPDAIAHDCKLFASTRVSLLRLRGSEVVGVEANSTDGKSISLDGPVCVTAGAVETAALLLRSGIANDQIGRTLYLHPGAAVAGIFDEVIEGWTGIPQSWECTEYLRFDGKVAAHRAWIVPAFAHPAALASMLPGFGAEHAQRMQLYPRLGVFSTLVHDASPGSIAVKDDRTIVRYALNAADASALHTGLRGAAELLFIAGAKQVLVPFAEPLVLRSIGELDRVQSHRYRPLDPLLTSVHQMGTVPVGRATDGDGRVHGAKNLWVGDGSLFASSIGGPPQLTIYAAAHMIGQAIARTLGRP